MKESSSLKMNVSICLFVLLIGSTLVSSQEKCRKLKDPDYEYYGTKTLYSDARKFLSTTDEDYLPHDFDDDSLEKEHNDLEENFCEPQVLYFIGRHSARFPDSEDIQKYNKDLKKLVDVLNSSSDCAGSLTEFGSWKSKMEPKLDNLVTEIGAREQRDIARRLKRIYPKFFDASKSKVNIGVTGKIRTAQTGVEFLHEIDNLDMPSCETRNLPTNDIARSSYDVNKILESQCYKDMISKYRNSSLEFHDECDKIGGETKEQDELVKRIKNPELLKPIADKIANKLGLDNSGDKPPVTSSVVDSIYNMCKFENAFQDNSIWCDLFDKSDVEALEYIEDVKSYIKGAYGPKAKSRQSCPLVKNLLDTFHESVEANGKGDKKAYFLFTHAMPMKKLVATFGMFKDDYSFTSSQIDEFEKNKHVPKPRNWRTSFIIPFSSNIVLTLYKCQKPNKPIKYKILTALNEQAVKFKGCDDEDCKARKFFEAFDDLRDCNLEEICGKS